MFGLMYTWISKLESSHQTIKPKLQNYPARKQDKAKLKFISIVTRMARTTEASLIGEDVFITAF